MKTIHIFFLFIILLVGCKNNAELTMERGIQYFEWEMLEKSILEFKKIIHMFFPIKPFPAVTQINLLIYFFSTSKGI